MCDALFLERLEQINVLIAAINDAELAIISGGQESYKLDTGQSVIWVTKLNLATIKNMIPSLLNECTTINARLNGSGTSTAVPAW